MSTTELIFLMVGHYDLAMIPNQLSQS
jgi:hypothetical protein